MNWGYFFAWVAVIFALFFITGWPVTPALEGKWGNHYEDKNLTYFAVLYFHYFIGALFFVFFILGLLRNVIWKGDKGGNRQIAFLLAYSFMISSIFGIVLVHRYAPQNKQQEVDQASGANQVEASQGGDMI